MSVLRKLFGKKEPDRVPALLDALGDENEEIRLQAVSSLGQMGTPQALGPLLYALKDKSQEVRSAAQRYLACMGIQEVDAQRVTIVYNKKTPWKKGLTDWSDNLKQMAAILELPARVAGISPIAVFGDINRGIVGFLFDDEYKAVQAALKGTRKAGVFIWSDRAMVEYEFGFGKQEAIEAAMAMQAQGAIAFVAGNCDPALEGSLQDAFKAKALLRW